MSSSSSGVVGPVAVWFVGPCAMRLVSAFAVSSVDVGVLFTVEGLVLLFCV